jgi:hypothetical protein
MKALEGPLSKVKAVLAKATGAVTNLVRKDDDKAADGPSATADHTSTDNAKRMKDAVEAARKNQSDD